MGQAATVVGRLAPFARYFLSRPKRSYPLVGRRVGRGFLAVFVGHYFSL